MRIFLIHTCKPSSGEWKANTSFLKYLRSRDHECAQLCYAGRDELFEYIVLPENNHEQSTVQEHKIHLSKDSTTAIEVSVTSLTDIHGIQIIAIDRSVFKYFKDGDMVGETKEYIETNTPSSALHNLSTLLLSQVTLFQPTHILFSDALSLKLTSSTRSTSSTPPSLPIFKQNPSNLSNERQQKQLQKRHVKRIYMLHSAEQLPAGPFAGGLPGTMSCSAAAELLKGVDGVWAMSEALKEYIVTNISDSKDKVSVFPPHGWTYRLGTDDDSEGKLPAKLDNGDKDLVAMMNPSDVKGVDILIGLAEKLPQIRFAVWMSWAADGDIKERLEQLENVEIRPTATDMEEVWSEVRVLLIPSLWFEAWGLVTVEAQLRGIPVISSNVGGIPEAKLGLPYIVPVNPLTGDHNASDKYVIPTQDVKPWINTLVPLMADQELYEQISNLAREQTVKWISEVDDEAQMSWFENL